MTEPELSESSPLYQSLCESGHVYEVDDEPDSPWWRWEVRGTETSLSPGARSQLAFGTGIVRAEDVGEALTWLVEHGPMWECLDDPIPVAVMGGPPDADHTGCRAERRISDGSVIRCMGWHCGVCGQPSSERGHSSCREGVR